MNHFARSSLLIAFFFGIDKILGFVRTVVINRQFGLSYELDVFNAANNVPDLLSALISGGALGVALIPVLSEYLERKGRPDTWDLFSRIVNLAFIVTASIAVLVAIFAPWLVQNVIAPGFPAEQIALSVELMRLDLFAILIFSVSGLVMAGLQANQHFLLPALAPGLYNIGQIFGAVVLARTMGVHGLVYGVILGAALHLAVQIPGLVRHGFRWTRAIDLRNEGVRQVLRLLGPRVLTMFFLQFFFIVRDNLASRMGEGAVTALNLGWFIMQVPETLLGTAIAIALLPTVSELFARGDKDGFRDTMNAAARTLLALTIPAAVLLAVAVRPLVQAAFGFDAAGTESVVLATRAYLLGLTGHALLEISARSFYAQQDAKTPLIAAALNAFAYLGLALSLSNVLGLVGIAIANSVVFTTEALVLLWLLNRRYPGLFRVGGTFLRISLASAGSGLILFFLLRLGPLADLTGLNSALAAAAGMALGLAVALPFMWPELRLVLKVGPARLQPVAD